MRHLVTCLSTIFETNNEKIVDGIASAILEPRTEKRGQLAIAVLGKAGPK
jgi:hypothetical protein